MIDKKDILAAVEKKKKQMGFREIKSAKVSRIGMGENNLNFLAEVNGKKFLFRVAMRKTIEKNMKREYEFLKTLPKGFGPEPYFFDGSKKIIPKLYSVFEYMEGRHIRKWGKKELKMHAEKLAELHRKKYPYWGRHYQKSKKPYDVYKFILMEIKSYKKDSPEIFEDKDIQEIMPKVIDYFKANRKMFTSLKRFSLCHRDPCITNILLTKEGIRYIDWEWAGYWDNAMDVAMLFDPDMAQQPWKIKLNGERLDYFLRMYQKKIKGKTLKKRVMAYTTYLKFTDLMFFKWKVRHYEKSDLPKKLYAKYEKMVSNSLRKLIPKWE